jgi:hypothetical protein
MMKILASTFVHRPSVSSLGEGFMKYEVFDNADSVARADAELIGADARVATEPRLKFAVAVRVVTHPGP